MLPRLLSADLYGGFELALSLAALIGSAVGLGVPQAAPRLKLILGHDRLIDLLALAFLLSALPLLAASFTADWLGMPWVAVLTAALATLYGGQYGLSFWARVEGRKFLSTWVDNGLLVLLGSAAAGLTLLKQLPAAREILTALWSVDVGLILAGAFLLIRHHGRDLWYSWRRALAEGLPLLLTGFVLAAFAAAPRLLAGRFLPLADVGALALAARVCLVLLVVHQLMMTWNFRNLYTWPVARCDRVFAGLIAGLSVLGCCVLLVWPWAARLIAPDYSSIPALVVGFVAAQTILWIALALFESLLGRQGLGRKAAPTLALVGLILWGGIEGLFLLHPASPALVALVSGGLLAAGTITQWLLLHRSGFTLPWAGAALAGSALPPLTALLLGL